MSIRLTAATVAALAGVAFVAPAAHSQVIPWATATDGNWSDITKWTGGNVPNAPGESARFAVSGVYTVSQNAGPLTIDALTIDNTGTTLLMGGSALTFVGAGLANSGLMIQNVGGSTLTGALLNRSAGRIEINPGTFLAIAGPLTNNGIVTINPTAAVAFTTLQINGPVTIDGAGEILLNAFSARAQITAGAGGLLTIGAAQLVHGYGFIGTPFNNTGTIDADVLGQPLQLTGANQTNNALMRASNGGTLLIASTTLMQGAGGIVRADGGNVDLTTGTIVGGTIETVGASRVRTVGGINMLRDVLLTGEFDVNPGTTTVLQDGLTNDGTLLVNPTGAAVATTLQINGPMTIDGTGDILLNGFSVRAQITAGTGGLLTIGADQLVRGYGFIGTPFNNTGTIDADEPGQPLQLTGANQVNSALVRASNGGTLLIASSELTQGARGAGGVLRADGGNVDLIASTIVGGTIETVGASRVRTFSGVNTLRDVLLTGEFDVSPGTTTVLQDGLTNEGTLLVNPTAAAVVTTLLINGAMTIDGAGTIQLNGFSSRAQITAGTGGLLTIGADQRVHGFGLIMASFNNTGVIEADETGQTLQLTGINQTNNALVRASNGGTLLIGSSTLTQGAGGALRADGGTVDLISGTVVGGTIETVGASRVRSVSGTSTLRDTLLAGQFDVNPATITALQGAFTNDGTLLVNPTAAAVVTTLQINGPVTIDGTGEILLNGFWNRAQLIPGTGGALTLGSGQTLGGSGLISMPLTLEGTLSPGISSIDTMAINSTATTITYAPTSTLAIDLGSLSSFDRITSGSHTILGGTLQVSLVNGYTPAPFDAHIVIDGTAGSVVAGAFDAIVGPALTPPYVWKVSYTGQDVVVGVSCDADYNSDLDIDVLDLLDFLSDYAACDGAPAPCGGFGNADLNEDGTVDILDFLDFLNIFANGC